MLVGGNAVRRPLQRQRGILLFFKVGVPGHRTRCSRPFVASEPGCRRQALVSWILLKGALVGSVTTYRDHNRIRKITNYKRRSYATINELPTFSLSTTVYRR